MLIISGSLCIVVDGHSRFMFAFYCMSSYEASKCLIKVVSKADIYQIVIHSCRFLIWVLFVFHFMSSYAAGKYMLMFG
uniref:Putative ovule protein n=1 Tax=Solanum chacoense TaxID=4108 RepID=A0A0V0H5J1_SOLCH